MKRLTISILFIVTLVLGCTPSDDPGNGNSPGGSVSDLSGRLYYNSIAREDSEERGLVSYDPQTYTENLIIPDEGIKYFSISNDAKYIAIVSSSLAELAVFNRYDFDDVIITDANEKYKPPFHFSSDDKHFAYRVDYAAVNSLRIRNSNGGLYEITREMLEPYTDRPALGWDWTGSNSLIFSSANTIYQVNDIGKLEFSELIGFSGNVDVGNIVVSNDGTKVAFTLSAAYKNDQVGDAYVMNIDGGGVRQLTKDRGVRDIAWSPDDKYIALVTGSRNAGGEVFPDKCTRVFAVPVSTDSPVSISLSGYEPAILLQRAGGSGLEDLCISARSTLYWLSD